MTAVLQIGGRIQSILSTTPVPLLFRTACHHQSVHPLHLPPAGMSQDTSLWPGLCPIDTSMPDDLLMLGNCLIAFAAGHWFGCRTTEPRYAGDLGAIEIWLIDWLNLIIWWYQLMASVLKYEQTTKNHVNHWSIETETNPHPNTVILKWSQCSPQIIKYVTNFEVDFCLLLCITSDAVFFHLV